MEVVDKLLLAATDIFASHRHDRLQALWRAATKGHLEVVKRFIIAKLDVNEYSNHETVLQAAARAGHLEVVECFIAAKAKVNTLAAGYPRRTALQAAAGNGHLEVIDSLLKAKAVVNAGRTEFDGGSDDRTALEAAAENGHLEVVERLLTTGANVNSRAILPYEPSPFNLALRNGHARVVQRLLETNVAREDVLASYKRLYRGDDELTELLEFALEKAEK